MLLATYLVSASIVTSIAALTMMNKKVAKFLEAKTMGDVVWLAVIGIIPVANTIYILALIVWIIGRGIKALGKIKLHEEERKPTRHSRPKPRKAAPKKKFVAPETQKLEVK